ncbi:hypothetical protein L2E82_31700 [Cichorium intybus]|uniref:Uncharacterized protein n=1 Tax=Cichorium intybus TaxID=13427 RepID=A0ACB9BGM8_CICIN|nr:hypothetical protein L2E82_31700 [Cichorium intybus]
MMSAVVRMLMLLVFVGWLMMWVMLPTKTYKYSWMLTLANRLNSTYFREQGTNLVLFSFPIMFLASLGCLYLHFQKKSCSESNLTRRSSLDLWKRPLIVMNPLGIVSTMELVFAAMFIALLGWSLYNYLHVSFGHLHMHKVGEKVWQAKFRSVSLRLGYIGNITWAFLFFPVTRGSSILRLVGLTSESSVKYHIWLGHLSMVLFTAHSVGFVIYWAMTDQMALMKEWSRTYLSNVAGEIAFVLALIMWVTSIPGVRRKMFELFFYTHQTYILYLFFYIIHVGVAYFCLILPGIFLFLIDRYLRFLQSRTSVRLIAARLLPCDTLELNFSKIAGLEYYPASILFVNVPLISKLQWHPFTVTSNANMEPETLSIVIKCQGTWSHKLYQELSDSAINRLQVSVEGPYGPTSPHFLRYENLVLISGGSGITPFISIIRELTFQKARQEQQPDKNQKIPTSVLLICAFKNSADLSMLDLLIPLTSSSTPSDLSQIDLQIQAYITREAEQQQSLENTMKPLRTIWFKPNLTDSPVSPQLGPDSWLWLCAIISSSFIMFLILLGIVTRYHIYPKDHIGDSVYNYTFKTLWDMLFVCVSVFLATSFVYLWQKKENDKSEGMKVQNFELGEVREIERFDRQSVAETTEVHFGHRPDLERMLKEKNKKGADVGVLVCGPRKMRHEVAKICSSKLAKNLHLESMSFNWIHDLTQSQRVHVDPSYGHDNVTYVVYCFV